MKEEIKNVTVQRDITKEYCKNIKGQLADEDQEVYDLLIIK